MSTSDKARFAYIVPWKGITGKPAAFDSPTGKIQISDVNGLQSALDSKLDKGGLAKVATTGQYSDLLGLPVFGSAAFAATTDFQQASSPKTRQLGIGDLVFGVERYEVEFSVPMKAPPKIQLQVMISDGTSVSDGTGDNYYAMVAEDFITTTGFRFKLSNAPAFSTGKVFWLAFVEDETPGTIFLPIAPPPVFEPETDIWIAGIDADGGTYEPDSKTIANDLVVALKAKPYYSSIIYMLPLLGADVIAARMPLIDTLAVGIATNVNFINSDFSQSTGLQGNGTTKYLNSLVRPSQLSLVLNGGLGYWEGNFVNSSNSEVIGCYNNAAGERYVLDLRSTIYFFPWGVAGLNAQHLATAGNHDYYGNRSSSTLKEIYQDGLLMGSNTTSDIPTGLADNQILIVGANNGGGGNFPCNSRCKVAYMTDGTLNAAQALDLHNTFATWLMGPTGR